MLDFRVFHYAAPPRTGNGWILEASRVVGIKISDAEAVSIPFPKERGKQEVFRVSLVRNPCDWLRSCYAALLNGDIYPDSVSAFGSIPRGSFFEFVNSYLNIMPGGIGHLFRCYKADSYLRIEDMPWAFIELLESLQVPKVLRDKCRELPAANVSLHLPRWNPHQRAAVVQVESELCETYDYS